MAEYKEVKGTIRVPPNTGLEGFLHTIKTLMKRPRLQGFEVDSRGIIRFRRFAAEGEEDGGPNNNFGVDLEHLEPYHVVRNAQILELVQPPEASAAVVIGLLFDKAAVDQLHPVAFVINTASALWEWYRVTTGYSVKERGRLFGLPVLLDRNIPDTALLLCAGFGRDAAFVDTQLSYKVEIPVYPQQQVSHETAR